MRSLLDWWRERERERDSKSERESFIRRERVVGLAPVTLEIWV